MALQGINVGRMDVRITIQQPGNNRNKINEVVEGFVDFTSCFVSRLRKPGGEGYEAQQQVGTEVVECNGRWSALKDVTNRMRFTLSSGTEYYYILEVRHCKREGYSILTAEKRDNQ